MKFKSILASALIFVIMVYSIMLQSCSKGDDGNSGGYPKTVNIQYKLTATNAPLQVMTYLSYTNETGGTTGLDSMAMPYTKTIRATVKQGDPISLYARHISRVPNTLYGVKLDILVDGALVATKTEQANGTVIGAVTHVFR
jgi:hypothetical protein